MKKIIIPVILCVLTFIIVFFATQAKKPNPTVSSEGKSSSEVFISSVPVSSTPVLSSIAEEIGGFDVNEKGLPIILYHHILTPEQKGTMKNSIITTTEEFESHLKLLKEKGYTAISAKQAEDFVKEGKPLPKKSVFINFDDGYKSNVYLAAPIMRKYGFQALVFVITEHLEKPDEEFLPETKIYQYVTKSDMEKASDVFEYAPHMHKMHTELTKQPESKVILDLNLSRSFISSPYFAYPIGDFDVKLEQTIKKCGITAAYTTKRGHAKKLSNPLTIPRYTVLTPTTPSKLLDIVEGRALK